MSQLSLFPMHGFPSNLGCCFPWAIRSDVFELLLLFCEYVSYSLTLDPKGAKTSKHCYSYKSGPSVFKLSLKFLLNGPHKITFRIFENLTNEILAIFLLTLYPVGAKISKRYSCYKSQPKVFQTSPNFCSMVLTKLRFGLLRF